MRTVPGRRAYACRLLALIVGVMLCLATAYGLGGGQPASAATYDGTGGWFTGASTANQLGGTGLTWSGPPSWSAADYDPSRPGSYDLDGTETLSDTDTSVGDLGSGDFTIGLHFRTSQSAANIALLSKQVDCTGNGTWLQIDLANGGAYVQLVGSSPYGFTGDFPGGGPEDSAWHDLQLVRSGNQLDLILDGTLATTASYSGAVPSNSAPLTIGGGPCAHAGSTIDAQLDGQISDVYVGSGATYTLSLDHTATSVAPGGSGGPTLTYSATGGTSMTASVAAPSGLSLSGLTGSGCSVASASCAGSVGASGATITATYAVPSSAAAGTSYSGGAFTMSDVAVPLSPSSTGWSASTGAATVPFSIGTPAASASSSTSAAGGGSSAAAPAAPTSSSTTGKKKRKTQDSSTPSATAGPSTGPATGPSTDTASPTDAAPSDASDASSPSDSPSASDTLSATPTSTSTVPTAASSAPTVAVAAAPTDGTPPSEGSGSGWLDDHGNGPSNANGPDVRDGSTPGGPAYGSGLATAPTVLTHSLPSITKVLTHPSDLAASFSVGLVWTLLLVLAMDALDKGLKSRYGRWSSSVAHVRIPGITPLVRFLASGHWLPIVGLLALNAFVLAFVDPTFSWSATSVRLVVSIAAGLLATVTPYAVAAHLGRRRWGTDALVHAAPWGVLIGIGGVLVSRIVGFVPGLLSGSTVQFATGEVSPRVRAELHRLRLSLTLVVVALCWVGDTLLVNARSWGLLFLHDACAAALVSAIISSFIELMPLAFFAGRLLFAELRRSWIVLALIVGFLFTVIVLPDPVYWVNVGGSVGRWLTVAMIAVVAALLILTVMHRRDRRRAQAAVIE